MNRVGPRTVKWTFHAFCRQAGYSYSFGVLYRRVAPLTLVELLTLAASCQAALQVTSLETVTRTAWQDRLFGSPGPMHLGGGVRDKLLTKASWHVDAACALVSDGFAVMTTRLGSPASCWVFPLDGCMMDVWGILEMTGIMQFQESGPAARSHNTLQLLCAMLCGLAASSLLQTFF